VISLFPVDIAIHFSSTCDES